MSKKRAWFFNAPQNSSGNKFVKNNIPTQETYKQLLDSIPFFDEASDEGTESRRGIFRVYTNDDFINSFNAGFIPKGHRKVMKASQVPLITISGYTNDVGISVPINSNTNGAVIKKKGLKLQAIVNTYGSEKRLMFNLEFDPSSLNPLLNDNKNIEVIVYNPDDDKPYKTNLHDIVGNSVHDNRLVFEFENLSFVWSGRHDLGYIPLIKVLVWDDSTNAFKNANVSERVTENEFYIDFRTYSIPISYPGRGYKGKVILI